MTQRRVRLLMRQRRASPHASAACWSGCRSVSAAECRSRRSLSSTSARGNADANAAAGRAAELQRDLPCYREVEGDDLVGCIAARRALEPLGAHEAAIHD